MRGAWSKLSKSLVRVGVRVRVSEAVEHLQILGELELLEISHLKSTPFVLILFRFVVIK